MTVPELDAGRLAHFNARVLADALSEATGDYWRTRAARFRECVHRPGVDYPGRRTAAELEEHNRRVLDKATACENRATLEGPGMAVPPIIVAELLGVLS